MRASETCHEVRATGTGLPASRRRAGSDDAAGRVQPPVRVGVGRDCELVLNGLQASLRPFASRVEMLHPDLVASADLILQDPESTVGGMGLSELKAFVGEKGPRVVAFGWPSDPVLAQQSIDDGAFGYLCKAMPARRLVEGLLLIAAGEQIRWGADGTVIPTPVRELPDGLSAREYDVLRLVAEGLANQEIANTLFLSNNTIKTYIRTSYRKIGVTRRSQAVAWFLQQASPPTASRVVSAGSQAHPTPLM